MVPGSMCGPGRGATLSLLLCIILLLACAPPQAKGKKNEIPIHTYVLSEPKYCPSCMYGVCEGDFQFTLLHTEDSNGEYVAVNAYNGGCAPVNGSYVSFTECNGGFARRATLIKQLRSQAQNSLLIDSSPFVRGKRKLSKCCCREMVLRDLEIQYAQISSAN